MRKLGDYKDDEIRLTKERLDHILEHPEMTGMQGAIVETLRSPETITKSLTDSEARLYYRYYKDTAVGDKYLCVVVKQPSDRDAFILTAYLTDKVKRGEVIWPKRQ